MKTQIHSGPNTLTGETAEPNSQVAADRTASDRALLRFAAVAIPVGLVLQILMETLHPSKADPTTPQRRSRNTGRPRLGPSSILADSSPHCWSSSLWSHSPELCHATAGSPARWR